ncbi:MAG: ABC1 kinase family protein [Candidatus Nanosalina sp.]
MGVVDREIEDVKRFDEIVRVLAEQEMGMVLDRLDLKHRLPFVQRFTSPREKEPKPERLRETLERLGPTFVKFGQIMAQRPDVIPQRYIDELEKLEDSVSSFESSEARRIIEQEVGGIDEVFSEFDDEPMAAASIAQVHKATLNSGDEVIVKVRRPGIEEDVATDLEILEFLAKRAEKHSEEFQDVRLLKLVEEFDKWINEEMNFEKEARNAEIIQGNTEGQEKVKIPDVYTELSTKKVLVMEYVEGVKCTEDEKLKELDVDISEVTRRGIRMGLNQVIRDGFFHADPHPSNFFIDEDGKIILIDFGMVGKLTKKTRERLGLLFLHIANEDVESAVDVIMDIGRVDDDADIDCFKEDVEEMILMLRNSRVKDASLTKTAFKLVVQASSKGIYLPTNLVLTAKTLVTIEGILLTVNPEAEVTDEYQDEIERILKEQNSPEQMGKSFMIDLLQNKDLLTKAPSKISKKLDSDSGGGTTKVEVEETSDHHEDILTAGLILAATFLLSQVLPSSSLRILGVLFLLAAAILFSKRI